MLISGISGSGKTVALRLLEDTGYSCVDNLPVQLLSNFLQIMRQAGQRHLAVAIDARSVGPLDDIPDIITRESNAATDIRLLFLDASDTTLLQRFSETRRRHPLTGLMQRVCTDATSDLQHTIHLERISLQPLRAGAHVIDTSVLSSRQLRQWVSSVVSAKPAPYTLTFESFAFKQGVPLDADFVFDVRCLPNPYYDPTLREMTGMDVEVANFFERCEDAQALISDVIAYLTRWLPKLVSDGRAYVTVALGCTGGQHRSVYCAEQLGEIFRTQLAQQSDNGSVIVRHRQLK